MIGEMGGVDGGKGKRVGGIGIGEGNELGEMGKEWEDDGDGIEYEEIFIGGDWVDGGKLLIFWGVRWGEIDGGRKMFVGMRERGIEFDGRVGVV